MSNIQSIGAKNTILDDLNLHGYVRLPFKLDDGKIEALRLIFEDNVAAEEAGHRFSGAKAQGVLAVLQDCPQFLQDVELALGPQAIITRALFLRKSDAVNWPLTWHQDVTIITKVSSEIPPGFGPVSYKNGLPHITATAQFLAGMMSARIHLDDTDQDKGALEIIPGSHKRGRLPQMTLDQEMSDDIPAYVPAQKGEIHFFRPLILHRSGKIKGEAMCRVIQLELSPQPDLPSPLEWLNPVDIF